MSIVIPGDEDDEEEDDEETGSVIMLTVLYSLYSNVFISIFTGFKF